ncbi:MAG: hypothetical protein PVJ04_11220 [Gemmatimonadota bacterium]|jgi:hypothetical protein
MKLTVEENPETIKRWGHIRPAPIWGAGRCSDKCPGSTRRCTLVRDHRGPHVAHGVFNRVMAVWDVGVKDRGSDARRAIGKARRTAGTNVRSAPRDQGVKSSLGRFWRRISRLAPSMEGVLLIILCLGMALFAIDTALRILGWR